LLDRLAAVFIQLIIDVLLRAGLAALGGLDRVLRRERPLRELRRRLDGALRLSRRLHLRGGGGLLLRVLGRLLGLGLVALVALLGSALLRRRLLGLGL